MSSNSLARLSVELAANTAAFQGDMGKAARIAEKEMASIKDAAGKMGLVLGGALAAAGGAFAVMAKAAIDAADDMNDMSQKVGVSVEKLSALGYAAKMSGTDTQTLATGLQKLNSNVVDAARGQGAAKDAFAALGISVRGANGEIKSQDQIMREVADKFATFEDGATKSALAVDIFGKAGAELIPMLDGGAAGLDAMKGQAESLGLVIDEKTARAAGDFNDNLDMMKLALGGTVTKVTAEMLPTMKAVSDQFLKAATDGDFLKNVADGLAIAFKTLVTVGIGLKATLTVIGDSMGQLAAGAVAFIKGDFAQAKAIFTDTTAIDDWKKTVGGIGDIWYGTAAAADVAAAAQDKALGKGPAYAAKGSVSKGKKPKKSGEDWDSEFSMSIDQWAAEEEAKNAAILAKQREGSTQQIQQLQQTLMSKRMLEMQAFNQKRMELEEAVKLEVINETQKQALMEDLERQHKARIKDLDEEEFARRKQYAAASVSFTANALAAIGARSSAAAKAGMALSKMVALNQIRMETPKAAMSAAAAVAGIPVIGPALAVGAKIAMYALGAAQAAAVMAGGSTSSGGGGSFNMSAGASSVPSASTGASSVDSENTRRDDSRRQATLVAFPADRMVTGRELVAFLDEAFGDGARLENVRFVLQ